MVGTLTLRPVKLRAACAFVRDHHRHHGPPRGHLWSIGLDLRGQLVGVAIIGRPLARLDDDGFTFEVLRVCTLGHANACSMLYGAAWRSARAMGYRRGITFTLPEENGASLRGAGWRRIRSTRGGTWSRSGRPREFPELAGSKVRWEVGPVDNPVDNLCGTCE